MAVIFAPNSVRSELRSFRRLDTSFLTVDTSDFKPATSLFVAATWLLKLLSAAMRAARSSRTDVLTKPLVAHAPRTADPRITAPTARRFAFISLLSDCKEVSTPPRHVDRIAKTIPQCRE